MHGVASLDAQGTTAGCWKVLETTCRCHVLCIALSLYCSPDGAAAKAGVQCGDLIVKVKSAAMSYLSVSVWLLVLVVCLLLFSDTW